MPLPRLNRRRFLKLTAAAAGTAVAAGLYAWRVEPVWLEVVHRPLPVRGLPTGWVGRRLVQLSDLHVGRRVDPDYLVSALRRVSDLRPDLVAITGDFMSCESTEQLDEVARILGHLDRPRFGTVAVLGNHDYGVGWAHPALADALTTRLRSLGLTVLRNQACDLDGLTVIGLDDLWGGRFDTAAVAGDLTRDAASVVLCHNPDAVDRAGWAGDPGWAGYRGWVLSGHTHGGQVKPPFLPPPLLPVMNRRYTAGAFDLWDGRWLYVNRGLGHLLRVRFNVRPEATVFELVAA